MMKFMDVGVELWVMEKSVAQEEEKVIADHKKKDLNHHLYYRGTALDIESELRRGEG